MPRQNSPLLPFSLAQGILCWSLCDKSGANFVGIKLVHLLVNSQKYLLTQILGFLSMADNTIDDGVNLIFIAIDQFLKSFISRSESATPASRR